MIPADDLPAGAKTCPADSFKPTTWLCSDGTYDYTANNINGMLAPVFDGEGDVANLRAPKLLSVDRDFYEGNLLLLPGSIELSKWALTASTPMFECRRFGVFRKMFNLLAQSYSTKDSPLEFIIIDLGPSIDEINKALVMSSDYILPPANADYFSCSSVRGLLYEVLPSFLHWRKQHQLKVQSLRRPDHKALKDDGFYDFADKEWPKVLPVLVSAYPVESAAKSKAGQKRKAGDEPGGHIKRKIEQAPADFIHSMRILIRGCTSSDEIDSDSDWDPLPEEMIVKDGDGHVAVPFCRHLPTAPSVSHRSGVPAVHLHDHPHVDFEKHGKEVKAGGHGNMGKREAQRAKERFETLALFVQEQRRLCLQARYELPPHELPPVVSPPAASVDAGGSSRGRGRPGPGEISEAGGSPSERPKDLSEGGGRKSRRALGLAPSEADGSQLVPHRPPSSSSAENGSAASAILR